MSGPEHYAEAERLLRYANRPGADSSNPGHRFNDVVAEAQVHATLALAAATLECATEHADDDLRHINGNFITQGANAKAWQEALS